jgi:geranylgeranyl diphosphate synthase type I
VGRLGPELWTVAAYHLGLADASGKPPAPGQGGLGKTLRPALVLLSARAAGRPPELAAAPAAAVELVHNFSLLHDDIMDGDEVRRHRPAAWTLFGIGAAILAGDALLALAQDALLEDTAPGHLGAARCLGEAVRRLIAGQILDLAAERRTELSLAECLRIAANKTAALMACACAIGAIHVGAPEPLVAGLSGFGEHIGLAFQLTDDLLGIWGEPEVTGKPVRADLRARKKSLPVVAAIVTGGRPGRRLRDRLADPAPLSEADLKRLASLVEEAGGRQWAEREADAQLAQADRCLTTIEISQEVRTEFSGIAEFITARQH